MIGGGATQGKEYIHFKYSEYILQTTQNIAQRELYAIMVAIKTWKEELAGKVIRLSTDNQLSMIAVNKGKTRDHFMLHCLREITWVCVQKQILLKTQYINTKKNLLPDLLSRWYNNNANVSRKFNTQIDSTWKQWSVTNQALSFLYFW